MEQFGILSLGSRLKRLSEYLFNEVQSVYLSESLAISATYFPILRLLQQGERSVVEISEGLGLSHPAVSKQVAKMLKDGLVDKVADKMDQRRSAICLSEFGQQEMIKVEPVLEVIGAELSYYLNQLSGDFLRQLETLEYLLLKGDSYALRILLRLHPERLKFSALQRGQEEAFKTLNMAWLERYFADHIYPQDIAMLNNPFNEIEQHSCLVKVAVFEGRVIGTYLLRPKQQGEMELCKLSVDEKFLRLGIGERLVKDSIRTAAEHGYCRLSLESHTSLTPALELYKKLGFYVCENVSQYSVPRANIKLELDMGTANKELCNASII